MDLSELSQLTAKCNQSLQKDVVVFGAIFFSAGALMITLRILCKIFYVKKLAVDDWLAVASVVSSWKTDSLGDIADARGWQVGGAFGLGFLIKWRDTGLGLHVVCMPFAQAQSTLKWSLAGQIETVIGVALIKVSICLRVLQVLDRVARYLRIFLWMLLVLIVLSHLSEVIMLFVWCIPLRSAWDSSVTGKCLTFHQLYIVTYIHVGEESVTPSLVFLCSRILRSRRTDRLDLLLGPRLHHREAANGSTHQDLALHADGTRHIVSGGFLHIPHADHADISFHRVAACAIAKLVHLPDLWNIDFTWTSVQPAKWAIAEQFLCVVLSSVPSIRPMFVKASSAISTLKKTKQSVIHTAEAPQPQLRRPLAHIPILIDYESFKWPNTKNDDLERGIDSQHSSVTLIPSNGQGSQVSTADKAAIHTTEGSLERKADTQTRPQPERETTLDKPLPPLPTAAEVETRLQMRISLATMTPKLSDAGFGRFEKGLE